MGRSDIFDSVCNDLGENSRNGNLCTLVPGKWPTVLLAASARKHCGVREIKTRELDSLPPIHGSPSRKVSPVLRRAAFAFAIRDCHYYSSPILIIEKIPSFGIRYGRAMQS
jgi:hypothetical protein